MPLPYPSKVNGTVHQHSVAPERHVVPPLGFEESAIATNSRENAGFLLNVVAEW